MEEKEPISASVNMADKADSSSTPPRLRPWTRSLTRTQAWRFGTLIRFRSLDDVESDGNDDEDSFVQSAGGSTSHRTLLSLYPNQYSVYMADNDEHNSRDVKGHNLSHMVEENSNKICLLETGQREILTQL